MAAPSAGPGHKRKRQITRKERRKAHRKAKRLQEKEGGNEKEWEKGKASEKGKTSRCDAGLADMQKHTHTHTHTQYRGIKARVLLPVPYTPGSNAVLELTNNYRR